MSSAQLKHLLRDETDAMVNQVYGKVEIEAKRAEQQQVHAYVKRTAAEEKVAKMPKEVTTLLQ